MRNDSDRIGKAKGQQLTFDAFLRTQPPVIRHALWAARGLGPPIDFVAPELGIGVELTEWLPAKRSQWVVERDRFREELLQAIDLRPKTRFATGDRGCTAVISVVGKTPSKSKRKALTTNLLDFLEDFERSHRRDFGPYGTIEVPLSALPSELQPHFRSLTLCLFPYANLGVVVTEGLIGQAIDLTAGVRPDSRIAIGSFRDRMSKKAVLGAEKYLREKQELRLNQLWMVVHYSSPGIFPEPFGELGLQVGYGEHRRASQEAVASRLSALAREVGSGPFDRIFFLVDCQPDPFSAEILSRGAIPS